MKYIRNFSIIAHIDHGKSTFSDRLIQKYGEPNTRKITSQILDSMEIERERGITIKAQSVTLHYTAKNKKIYQLNFIDTPGHVDFSYEVSRSLSACEGAILLVDSVQGVQAQTKANCNIAIKMNLKIIPVINKIDLQTANPHYVAKQIKNIIGLDIKNIISCSSKTGQGVNDVIERLIQDIPSPNGNSNIPLQALIIDSWFNKYLGVVSLIRIKNGVLKKNDKVKIMSTQKIYSVEEIGIFTPKRINKNILKCGEVGWVICGIKDISNAIIGDTITLSNNPAIFPLPNFKNIKPTPQVYAGIFPVKSDQYSLFRKALKKLTLNDSSILFVSEKSEMFGFGFRCGFLGLLHMEIIQERLEREYNLNLITTAPTVVYKIKMKTGEYIYIDNLSKLPSWNFILELQEPIAECQIIFPKIFLGKIINLCIKKRGVQKDINYYDEQIFMIWLIPMSEVIFDFFDLLKSVTKGYASLNYKFKFFKKSDLIRLDILINNKRIDSLSSISHRDNANFRGKKIVEKIKNLIPKQQFEIIVHAAVANRIISKATIRQHRKNVIAKCYGGDISRKKKLLKKQKEGKKRLKKIGKIQLPQEIFLSIVKIDQSSK